MNLPEIIDYIKRHNIEIIYLDMDGVMADFEKGFQSLYGNEHWIQFSTGEDDFRDEFKKRLVTDNFYLNLPTMEEHMLDIVHLVENHHCQILTSVSSVGSELVAQQKRDWIKANFCERNSQCLLQHFNFVKDSSEKALYSHQKALLLDDRDKCITYFKDANGHAIKII